MGPASATNSTLRTIADTKIKAIAVLKIRFASSGFSSPRLLAARAEIATFAATNKDSPINLGCVVRPTAATA